MNRSSSLQLLLLLSALTLALLCPRPAATQEPPSPTEAVHVSANWQHGPIPGQPSRLHVTVTSLRSAPIDAAVTVRHEGRTLGTGRTGPNGILWLDVPGPPLPPLPLPDRGEPLPIEPEPSPVEVHVTPVDARLRGDELTLPLHRSPAPGLVLPRVGLRQGEPLVVELRTETPRTTVEVGVILGGRIVHRETVEVLDHRRLLTLQLPADQHGLGTVTALSGDALAAARFVMLDTTLTPRSGHTIYSWHTHYFVDMTRDDDVEPQHLTVIPLAAEALPAPADAPPWPPFDLDGDEAQETLSVWLDTQPQTDDITWHLPGPSRLAPRPEPPPMAVQAVADALRVLGDRPADRDFDALLRVALALLAALVLGLAIWRWSADQGWSHRLATAVCTLPLLLMPLLAQVGAGASAPSIPPLEELPPNAPTLQNLSSPRRFPGLAQDYLPLNTLVEPHDALAPDTGTLVVIEPDGVTVDGVQVVRLEDGVAPADQRQGDLHLPALLDALHARRRALAQEGYRHDLDAPAAVTISAASTIPMQTLLSVCYTAGQAEFDRMRLVRAADWTAVAPPVFGPASSPGWFLAAFALVMLGLARQRARWPSWVALIATAAFAALMLAERRWPLLDGPVHGFPLETAAAALAPWLPGLVAVALVVEAFVARRAPRSSVVALAALIAVLLAPLTRDYRLYAAPTAESVLLLPRHDVYYTQPTPPPRDDNPTYLECAAPRRNTGSADDRERCRWALLLVATLADGHIEAAPLTVTGPDALDVRSRPNQPRRFDILPLPSRRPPSALAELFEPTPRRDHSPSVNRPDAWFRRQPLSQPRLVHLRRAQSDHINLLKLLGPAPGHDAPLDVFDLDEALAPPKDARPIGDSP